MAIVIDFAKLGDPATWVAPDAADQNSELYEALQHAPAASQDEYKTNWLAGWEKKRTDAIPLYAQWKAARPAGDEDDAGPVAPAAASDKKRPPKLEAGATIGFLSEQRVYWVTDSVRDAILTGKHFHLAHLLLRNQEAERDRAAKRSSKKRLVMTHDGACELDDHDEPAQVTPDHKLKWTQLIEAGTEHVGFLEFSQRPGHVDDEEWTKHWRAFYSNIISYHLARTPGGPELLIEYAAEARYRHAAHLAAQGRAVPIDEIDKTLLDQIRERRGVQTQHAQAWQASGLRFDAPNECADGFPFLL